MSMTQTQGIAEGDRIYATEVIDYYDFKINPGADGTVLRVSDSEAVELLIEWDAGVQGMADSGSVALIDDNEIGRRIDAAARGEYSNL